MLKGKMRAPLAGIIVLAAIAAACGNDGSTPGPGNTDGGGTLASGSISISGSSTVEPISNLVAELFNETHVGAEVGITVAGPGTGDGFVLFCKGEIDIADASRPIEDEEAQACADAGIEYVELEVAFDGITVMTNPANADVTCLNKGDLYALFGPESDGFANWSDADALASEVGGTDSFPDQALEITAPGEESGTYDAFIDLAGIEDTALEHGVAEDNAAALRSDYQSSGNDNIIIQAMEGNPGALGFVGFAFAQAAGDQVNEIEVDGGEGCVAPTADTIADGSYPLSRSLFIYVNKEKITSNPAVKPFVDFYLSDTGLVGTESAVGLADYVPLPQDRIDATRAVWDAAAA
ncbi:MAG TPA: substrate-binding domain-containing protein [Actinomycetota bacterium]|jgi:phosphate transport system substrate-binding protein|nr:substrate-binding domain-containing protein [Actinomycetota bacterium]